MTPSRFQSPSLALPASHTVCGGPPATSTRLSFPSAKNAMERLSADQNGAVAPSEPASGTVAVESSDRSHRNRFPSPDVPAKTSRLPLGEMVGTSPGPRVTLLGGAREKR